jgi:hypothetical protein
MDYKNDSFQICRANKQKQKESMNDVENKLIDFFCNEDDFNNIFINELGTHQLSDGSRKRIKSCGLIESEVMTIVVYFHLMRYRDIKHYYLFNLYEHMRGEFFVIASMNRFVKPMQSALLHFVVFLKTPCLGKCTGIPFVDSTPIRACHIKREHSNKVLKDLATKGHSSNRWFLA